VLYVVSIYVSIYWWCALCIISTFDFFLLSYDNVRSLCNQQGDCLHIMRILLISSFFLIFTVMSSSILKAYEWVVSECF
jgi:hypothetical protein